MQKRTCCRTCKHSKYVVVNFRKMLRCKQREAWGQKPYLPTDATDAEECLDYDPENWRDALTDRSNYVHAMKKCGIPLSEEQNGLLSRETLA